MLIPVRWISNSGEAETFLVFANIDPSKGYKGITCFVMSKDQGVEIAKKEAKVSWRVRTRLTYQLGIRASSTCQLTFDDVRLHEDSIVGEVGKGYKVCPLSDSNRFARSYSSDRY